MKVNDRETGSTLVEVITALIIASWMATGLLTLYVAASRGYAVLGMAAEYQYTARTALEQVQGDIHSAMSFLIAADGQSLDITAADQSVRFYCQNGQLYRWVRTVHGVTAIPIADNVRALSFSGSNQLVVVSLSIASGEHARTLTTAVQSRL